MTISKTFDRPSTRPQRVAREALLRSVPFTLARAADATAHSDGLTLDGYAAVFGAETLICSWEGSFYEQVVRGAFKKSLSERIPVLQFDHGTHPMVGSIPLGSVDSVGEDTQGLHVLARLADNWLTQPVRDGIANGSINGMSFRFTVVRDEWRDADGKLITDPEEILDLLWASYGSDENLMHRSLLELKCPELGPVVFPAYDETSVGVRSKVTVDLGRLDDPAQRRELARAVLIADAANAPEGTHQQRAADHATETPDTPQATGKPAGEHESTITEPAGLRFSIDYYLARNRVVVENATKNIA